MLKSIALWRGRRFILGRQRREMGGNTAGKAFRPLDPASQAAK